MTFPMLSLANIINFFMSTFVIYNCSVERFNKELTNDSEKGFILQGDFLCGNIQRFTLLPDQLDVNEITG